MQVRPCVRWTLHLGVPERSSLLQDWRIRKLTSVAGHFVHVSASAVGWFTILKGKEVSVEKKFQIWTTDDSVAKAFFPYHSDPNSKRKTFAECRGEVAKRTANYTELFAENFWRSQFYTKTVLALSPLTAVTSRTPAEDSSLFARGSSVTAIGRSILDPICRSGVH